MKISDIDENFKVEGNCAPDVVWHSVLEDPLTLTGVYYEEAEKRFRRMPDAVAQTVSPGVTSLSVHTAGGMIRFATDSSYIALKVAAPGGYLMSHITLFGQFGFGVYEEGKYIGTIAPTMDQVASHAPYAFEGSVATARVRSDAVRRMREYTVFFPLYSGVNAVYLGVDGEAKLEASPMPHGNRFVMFYGSSITQGGCTSHAGNDFVNILANKLGVAVLNLGFSGNGKGEDTMIDYLAKQDPAVFVLDYDHNAPNAAHLEATHEKLFRAFRAAHPTTPVIMVSQPDCDYRPESEQRRAIIRRTYENALREGDKYVRFIDGITLFGAEDRDLCTVDLCHPNDLGFYRMACAIYPVLKECLAL